MADTTTKDSTTEEVTEQITPGRSIRVGGKTYAHGDEKAFAKAAKSLHPDDLQLMANKGHIVGFGTDFVPQDEIDAEATHPIEYAEQRKAQARARQAGQSVPKLTAKAQPADADDEDETPATPPASETGTGVVASTGADGTPATTEGKKGGKKGGGKGSKKK